MFSWPLFLDVTLKALAAVTLLTLLALPLRLARGERLILALFAMPLAVLSAPFAALGAAILLLAAVLRHLTAGLLALAPPERRAEAGVLSWYLLLPLLEIALAALLVASGVGFDSIKFTGLVGGDAGTVDASTLGTALALSWMLGGTLCALILADSFGHSPLGKDADGRGISMSMWFGHVSGRLLLAVRGLALIALALYLLSAFFFALWSADPNNDQAAQSFMLCYVIAVVLITILAGATLPHTAKALVIVAFALLWLLCHALQILVWIPIALIEAVRDFALVALAVLADLALLLFVRSRRQPPTATPPEAEPTVTSASPKPVAFRQAEETPPATPAAEQPATAALPSQTPTPAAPSTPAGPAAGDTEDYGLPAAVGPRVRVVPTLATATNGSTPRHTTPPDANGC